MRTFLLSLIFSCFAFAVIAQPPITGTFNVCVGSTTALADATTGGVWSSSNIVVGTIDPSTGVAMGLSAGVTTITYNLGSAGFVTQDVTVNPLPATIAGPAKMCVGDVTTLTNATAGGAWSSSSPSVAAVGSGTGTIAALSSGITTISYTLPTGCATSYVLIVNPAAGPITGPNTVGIGGNITLTSPPSGGAWTSGNTGLATVGSSSGIVTGLSSGIVMISYTLPTGCFATYSVTVTPLVPTITISYATPSGGSAPMVCVGGTMTVSATPAGGVWTSSSNATATVGSASGIVTGVSTGNVVMTYTLSPGVFGTINIIVNPNPLISGPNNVCVGSAITLTGSPTGGVWSSGSPAVATVGSGTGVVTGLSAGTALITYMLSTGCFDVYSVTVNPAPGPIIGVPGTIGISICVGNSLTLTNAVPGGKWTSGNTTVATIGSTSGTVTGVTPGLTLITYTLSTGCFTVAPITVNPSPSAISGPSNVCTGSSINLTSSGGGVWSSGAPLVASVGSLTGTVTGISAGTAVITYMLPTGCFVTTTITVDPTPTIGASTGTQVCVGSTLVLSSSPTGGVWTSGNVLIATVGSSSGVITGISAGTVMITYTMPTGCWTSIQITVNPMPTVISGPASVCVGSTINLTSSPSGGIWSSGAPGTATISGTGVVTGISPGVATITYSLATGCFVTMDVTVNPVPTISSGSSGLPGITVCAGSTVTLTGSPTGGIWSSSNVALATVGSFTGVVTGVAAGVAFITYTLPTGCFSVVPVTVNPMPGAITGPSTVCVGNTITLTGSPSGGSWISGTPGVGTITGTGVVTGISPGVTTITYTLPGGCFTTTDVTVNPQPTIITGTTGLPISSLCVGDMVTLSSTPTGGVWTSSNTSVATVGSGTGVVTGISPGVVTITYTLSTGCFTTVTITVNPTPVITGPGVVCTGSTITLAGTPTGGVWTSGTPGVAGVGSSSGIVAGISAGTAVITYTLPTGCFATTTVTVNQTPTIGISTGLSICAGSSFTMPASPGGGVWSSGNTSVATIGSLSGIVVGVAPGVVTIMYTLSTGCFASMVITVNPMPTAITGPSAVCVGSSIGLGSTPTGGIWSSGNPSIATIGSLSGVVTGISPGVVNITYTLPAGCFVTTTITVNANPVIITGTGGVPGASVCVGNSVVLIATPPGGVWSSGNTTIATIGSASGIVTGVAPGVVVITYTLPTGCFATTTVTVYPMPVITGPLMVCVGSTANLTGTPSGGTWTSGSPGIATVGSASGIVAGVSAGTAVITYMMPSGCFATAVVTVNPVPRILGSTAGTTVCVGTTVTLTGIPSGGTWTSGNVTIATVGSASGIVTTLSPGIVIITYTLPTGCLATTAIVVVPAPGVISGSMSMCVGGTTVLFCSPGGGTWTSGSPGIATINPSTGVVTGVSAGTAVITYALSSGCISTATVTVNPNPSVIAGPSTVCVGTTITLTNSTPGGVWSSSNTTVATVGSSTGIVTGVTPGAVTIIYTLPTGCSASITIVVKPAPGPISGPGNICAGASVVFTGSGGGIWSSSNNGIATVGSVSGVVTGVSVGTATITYMLSNGCYVVKLVTVNPQPGPISGPPYVCVGNSVTLTVSPSGGTWTSSNPAMGSVNAVTGVVTGIAAGTVTITYTLPGGCFSTFVLPVRPLPCIPAGINDVATEAAISLFPNPANDELVIKTENSAFSSFTITNSVGQVMLRGQLAGKEMTVSVRSLPSGMYYFDAIGDNGMSVVKFVKL